MRINEGERETVLIRERSPTREQGRSLGTDLDTKSIIRRVNSIPLSSLGEDLAQRRQKIHDREGWTTPRFVLKRGKDAGRRPLPTNRY
ncbi:hypothetical protein NPIL_228491 [Nephila pilipes]|uniref:Uncharacterized protein n=1 Tax=Nephila pilipes TaxID=299642 RepID=A0A8X6PN89_NEPPI|nr:hypothetical protein NPIL_228491 [Nephila pilipes]